MPGLFQGTWSEPPEKSQAGGVPGRDGSGHSGRRGRHSVDLHDALCWMECTGARGGHSCGVTMSVYFGLRLVTGSGCTRLKVRGVQWPLPVPFTNSMTLHG